MSEGLDQAIPVQSIAEEYRHMGQARCPCGGRYRLRCQALVEDAAGRPCDRLEAQCARCGAPRAFLFDIDAFCPTRTATPG